MRTFLMYSVPQEHLHYITVSCHVTQIGYILYKLCSDWQQRTAQPDVCVVDCLFWWMRESRWPPTGWAIVATKYRSCWLILLYIQKFAWGGMKNQEDCRGNLDVSKQIFRDCVYNPAQGQVQFIGKFVRPFVGKSITETCVWKYGARAWNEFVCLR